MVKQNQKLENKAAMTMQYLAHSQLVGGREDIPPQSYFAHIKGVHEISQRHLARLIKILEPNLAIAISNATLIAALYHDLGKLDSQAQRVLGEPMTKMNKKDKKKLKKKGKKLINHVDAGVAHCLRRYNETKNLVYLIAAILIHAHHIGFLDYNKLISETRRLLTINYVPLDAFRDNKSCKKYKMKDIPVRKRVDKRLSAYLDIHKREVPIQEPTFLDNQEYQTILHSAMLLKICLSILVDADHENTSKNYGEPYPMRENPLLPEKRLEKLSEYIGGFAVGGERDKLRREFFDICMEGNTQGEIDLIDGTVGIGKTLALIGYALKSSRDNERDTVFFVLPYIALIDQSASQYQKAIGLSEKDAKWNINIIHSLFETKSLFHRKYLRGLNAPINMTTSVNFFKIITSNYTSVLKNLHKLVGSTICIDEYHTIASYEYWGLILSIFKDMVKILGCQIILSSGTPTEYWNISKIEDIVDCSSFDINYVIPEKFYDKMLKRENKRVKKIVLKDPLSFEELANNICEHKGSVFVIFNTRRKAYDFFRVLQSKTDKEAFLRFSALDPGDRKRQYEIIKSKNKKRESFVLVATQGSDIGLDLSFNHGFKELSNFDSVCQINGRINRNEEFDSSMLYVFKLNEKYAENPSLVNGIKVFERSTDVHDTLSPSECTKIVNREMESLPKREEKAMEDYVRFWRNREFESLSNGGSLIKMPTISILVNKEIYEKMCSGENVFWTEIQDNIVNCIMSPDKFEQIKHLLIPIEMDDDEEEDKEEKSIYSKLYFWNAAYDPDNYGIMAGLDSGESKPFIF